RLDYECGDCRARRARIKADAARNTNRLDNDALTAVLRNGYLPSQPLGSKGAITVAQVGLLEQAIERARENGEHSGFSIGGAWVQVSPLSLKAPPRKTDGCERCKGRGRRTK